MEIPLRGTIKPRPVPGPRLLERALTVVRFTPVMTIQEDSMGDVARFQDIVRKDYPLFERELEQMLRVQVQDGGNVQAVQEGQTAWRMLSIDRNWRVSLTSRSIAIETEAAGYTNWADFAARIATLVGHVHQIFKPSHLQSIGVRYLNTHAVNGKDDPRRDCTPELVSITGNSDLFVADLMWQFDVDEGRLILRSGLMPPNASYDALFNPRAQPTWYLDIDVVRTENAKFNDKLIHDSILAQCMRLHAIYCWALPGKAKRQGLKRSLTTAS